MEQNDAKEILDLVIGAVAEKNAVALESFMKDVAAPMLVRLDQIGQAQYLLAQLLRQVRRDRNATEFAKVLLEHRAISNKGKVTDFVDEIGHTAYQLANRMEEFALVSEAQALSAQARVNERLESELAERPESATAALLNKFQTLQRGAKA